MATALYGYVETMPHLLWARRVWVWSGTAEKAELSAHEDVTLLGADLKATRDEPGRAKLLEERAAVAAERLRARWPDADLVTFCPRAARGIAKQ